ncbi:MAG: PD-(D/E)XK nuclease family protein [Oscillospiraceae bacterium]|nr:PD-(D/E)XK nuclease family protein [Oscillospiraceae bacterium]
MLTIIYGRAKTGKTQLLLQQVKTADTTAMASRILIVPEQLSHQTERKLSAHCGDPISYVSEVLSFTRLTSRVFSLYGGGARQVLDNAGRILTAQMALSGILSQLKVFASAAGRPEFLSGVVELIDELKSYHITREQLEEAASETTGQFSEKLREIGLILSAYEGLTAQGAADPRDQLTRLAGKLQSGDYGQGRRFYVDGFTDFSTQELRVLEILLQESGSMTVTVLCDDPYGSDPLFAPGRETLHRLLKMAQDCGQQVELIRADYRRPVPEAFTYLEQKLLSFDDVSFSRRQNAVRTVSCRDRLEEARACAAAIRDHAMQGMRYRDMMICCGGEELYRGLLKSVFSELNIPLYTSEKTPVLSHPAIGFVLLSLDAALNGMETETVCACMKTGYSGLSDDSCDNLENYAITWAIRGSKWERDWVQHPDGLDGRDTEESRLALAALNQDRMRLQPLFTLRRELRNAGTVRGQIEALFHYLEETDLCGRLEQEIAGGESAGDLSYVQYTGQVWETLISCLQQIDNVSGQQTPREDYLLRILKLSLGQYQLGAIPSSLDCVTFGTVAAVRGNEPKLLYVLGMNEGLIPAVPSGGSLLTERERGILRDQMNITLAPDAEGVYQRELLKVYGAFSAPTEYLYLSLAGEDMGTALSASFLMERICSLFPDSPMTPPAEFGLSAETAAQRYLSALDDPEDASGAAAIGKVMGQCDELHKKIAQGQLLARERELLVLPAHSAGLFGLPVPLTASRLDELGKCPLEYFLDYGLKAKVRKEATFDAAEFGTFVHYILEKSIPEWVDAKRGPLELSESTVIVEGHLESYSQSRFTEEERSARDRYLFWRNGEEASLLLRDISQELSKSQFVPCSYELYFGGKDGPKAVDVSGTLGAGRLTGMVDRADLWRSEAGDFIRIIDYKSGSKKFDYTDLYGGVGMQMLLYLFALEQSGIQGVTEHPVPAGVLYVPAKHAFSKDGDSEEADSDPLRRSGLILGEEPVLEAMESGDRSQYLPIGANRKRNDYTVSRQQMGILRDFVEGKMSHAVDRILGGDFSPEPFYCGKSKDPCGYCDYADVCQKDPQFRRKFYHKALSAKDFWEKIGGEEDG